MSGSAADTLVSDFWHSIHPYLHHLPPSLRPASPTDLLLVGSMVLVALVLVLAVSRTSQPKVMPGTSSVTADGSTDKLQEPTLPSPEQARQLIKQRRAVFPKDYTGQTAPKAAIEAMLEAANWAPTHGKTEPWRFVVFETPEARQQLYDLTLEIVKEELSGEAQQKRVAKIQGNLVSKWPKVSHMIAICMKRQANPDKLMPEWEEEAATSAAVQNLWLMGTAQGVAGYWSSWYPEVRDSPKFKEFLWLEPEDKCLGMFLVGCTEPDTLKAIRAKRGPVAEKVSWRS